MRRLSLFLALLAVVFTAAAFRPAADAGFSIKCGQYNYCTFTGTESGTWQFSDWAAWGDAAVGTALSYSRPMSTHDPLTFSTPYTTTVTHTVGTAVEIGYVRCTSDWSPHGSMCRKVNNPN